VLAVRSASGLDDERGGCWVPADSQPRADARLWNAGHAPGRIGRIITPRGFENTFRSEGVLVDRAVGADPSGQGRCTQRAGVR